MCLGSCVVERCKMRRGAEGKREKEGVATVVYSRGQREGEATVCKSWLYLRYREPRCARFEGRDCCLQRSPYILVIKSVPLIKHRAFPRYI